MPFLPMQLNIFNRLHCDWEWHVVEGVAANRHDTSWCKPLAGRLSKDGTTQFLNTLESHPRIRLHRRQLWDGKVEMVNTPLRALPAPGVLMQVDADELWPPACIDRIVNLFATCPRIATMQFACRYFLGPNIVAVTPGCYGNKPGEWTRAWRFRPGDRFLKHEPPMFRGPSGSCFGLSDTTELDLVFDHWAYVFEKQVAFKEAYYGYQDATAHWRRLQQNGKWPVLLREFLPWVKDDAMADLLYR